MAEPLRRESASERSVAAAPSNRLVPLESILCTEELKRRPSRAPDYESESRALATLAQSLADSPRTILQTLADTILITLKADSAGMSLLTKDKRRFYWAAIAGAWKPHLGGGTPRDFGPCGDVLDRGAPLLFTRWERRYPYLVEATPLAEEGLLIPFHVAGEAVGTIWAITHDTHRKFDSEDLRQLESLSRFASAAYQAATSLEDRDQSRAALSLLEDAVLARQAAEALNLKLRENEQRMHAIIDAFPMAVYTTDAEGLLTHFNPAAVKLVGRMPMPGKDKWCVTWKLYSLDGRPMPHSECPMAVTLKEDRDVPPEMIIAERPDGTRAWVEVYPTRLRDGEGRTTGGVNVLLDVTERTRAESALIKSEKLAAAGRLAATLAHEINNPLQAVANLMTLLGNSPRLDKQDKRFAAMAEEELGRVVHLTQRSLSFYRESTSPTAVHLQELLDSVLELYGKRIRAKEIKIMKRYDSDDMGITSYPGEVRQVFSTLLVNAMEAVHPGGSIAIRLRKLNHARTPGVRIIIADSGVGIPGENISHIFEPFFTTKGQQGTGLGLWVTQGIVNRLGGTIRVRSSVRAENCGTVFSIFLPNQMPAAV